MIQRDEQDNQERDPALTCIIPGCTVNGPAPLTCVIWGGRRLCVPHFANYFTWSVPIVDRGPTDAEWRTFLGSIAHREAA